MPWKGGGQALDGTRLGRDREGQRCPAGDQGAAMHTHDHEHEHNETTDPSREKADQRPKELPRLLDAAAAGRTDVIGPGGWATLQRAVGNSAAKTIIQRAAGEEDEQRSSVHDVISSGGGQPLDTETRSDMEARLGADFSEVRVHTDARAHESAKDVGAHAYTVGNDVVFQRDAYSPSSDQGRTTLAHELTHVMQQREGPVEGTETAGGIRVSDPSDRFEQEAVATAARVMSGPAPVADAPPERAQAPASTSVAPVQRQEDDEGEDEEPADVQGSFVQRSVDEQESEPV